MNDSLKNCPYTERETSRKKQKWFSDLCDEVGNRGYAISTHHELPATPDNSKEASRVPVEERAKTNTKRQTGYVTTKKRNFKNSLAQGTIRIKFIKCIKFINFINFTVTVKQ